jgi:CubicO group peptidase (beta-lactamase class C family)
MPGDLNLKHRKTGHSRGCRLRRLRVLLALSLVILVGVADSHAASDARSPAAASLLRALQTLVDKTALPGAIAVIELDGRRIESARVGWQDVEASIPLREDAIFRLYSMSKPITSVAVMMLVEEGRLSLDDPAARYLPEFENMRVYVEGDLESLVTEPVRRPISIRDLLLHNSGIVYHFTGDSPVHRYYRRYGVMRDTPVGRSSDDGAPARSLDELVQRIGAAPLLHQPGSGFHYSYSTTVLGAVIERVTGERLDTALRRMLFDPLGMDSAGFVIDDDRLSRFTTLYTAVPGGIASVETLEDSDYRDPARLLDSGGAMVSTVGDYLRFARMLANGGELEGRRYLSEAGVEEMFKPHIMIPGPDSRSTGFGYGFLLGDAASEERGRQPQGTVGWSGSGNTFFFINPDTGMIGLFMTHVLTPPGNADRAAAFRQIMVLAAARALASDRI